MDPPEPPDQAGQASYYRPRYRKDTTMNSLLAELDARQIGTATSRLSRAVYAERPQPVHTRSGDRKPLPLDARGAEKASSRFA